MRLVWRPPGASRRNTNGWHEFRLREGSENALNEQDLVREDPLLLDPTSQMDTLMLTYWAEGKVVPRCEQRDAHNRERAVHTIDLLGLNNRELKKRRSSIWNQAMQSASDFVKASKESDVEAFERAEAELLKLCNRKSPFSSIARTAASNVFCSPVKGRNPPSLTSEIWPYEDWWRQALVALG